MATSVKKYYKHYPKIPGGGGTVFEAALIGSGDSRGKYGLGTLSVSNTQDRWYVDANGTLTVARGTGTNLCLYSEDLSQANWVAGGTASKDSATTLTFAAQNDVVSQVISTTANYTYVFSFKARAISGNTSLHIYHNDSATGNSTAQTVTSTLTRYYVAVLGKAGGGNVSFGIQDQNAAGHGQIEFTEMQVENLGLAAPDSFGPELLADGDFTTWNGANPDEYPDSFGVVGTDVNNYFEDGGGGTLHLVGANDATTAYIAQTFTTGFSPGDWLRFSADVTDVTAGDFRLKIKDVTNAANIISETMAWTAVGTYYYDFQVPTGCASLQVFQTILANTVYDYQTDNWSVKRIPNPQSLTPRTYVSTTGSTATIPAEPELWYGLGLFNRTGYEVRNTQNNELDGSNWTLTSASLTYNLTGPDGIANSAATLTDTASGDFGVLKQLKKIIIPGSATDKYTVNAIVKWPSSAQGYMPALSCNFVKADSTTSYKYGRADLYNKTTEHANASGSGIRDLGNGWLWWWVTATAPGTDYVYIDPYLYPSFSTLIGGAGVASHLGSQGVYAIWVNKGAYPLPFHPTGDAPGAVVGSTPESWVLSSQLAALFSSHAPVTVVADITFLANDADIGAANYGILTTATNASSAGQLYNNDDTFNSYDGTTAITVTKSIVAGTTYRVALSAEDADVKFGVSVYDTSWTHGTRSAYDGSFGIVGTPGSNAYLHLFPNRGATIYPAFIKNIKIYNKAFTTAQIEARFTP